MDKPSKPVVKESPRIVRRLSEIGGILSLGLVFGACLGIGIGIGYYADNRFGSGPWGVSVGFIWGLAAGIAQFYRILKGSVESFDRRSHN